MINIEDELDIPKDESNKGEMNMTKGFSTRREVITQFACLLEDWIPKDASIAIAMGEQYIFYGAGGHRLPLQEGQQIETGSVADQVLTKRCKVDAVIDATLIGIPYYGIGYPIEINEQPAALIIVLPQEYHVLRQKPFRFLTGKTDEEWRPIAVEEISHIESLQKKTWFYAADEHFSTNFTLKELALRLPTTFLRIHRSYIINISFIQRISRDFSSNLIITLKDGTELPVSQSYMSDVRTALGF